MAGLKLPMGKVIEIGYVVENLDQAIAFFRRVWGAGTFKIFEKLVMTNARFMGVETAPSVDVAMGASGGVVIELIKQWDSASSPFKQPVGGVPFLLNHFSVFVDNYDAELARFQSEGYPSVFSAEFASASGPAARIAYLDTWKEMGAYLEIMERSPSVLLDLYEGLINVDSVGVGIAVN